MRGIARETGTDETGGEVLLKLGAHAPEFALCRMSVVAQERIPIGGNADGRGGH